MSLRPIIPISAFLILVMILVIALVIFKTGRLPQNELPIFGTVPDFQFITHNNEPFTADKMLGKINVVDFYFTRCHSICPVMSARMAELYAEYKIDTNIQFISINVDPDNDSLPVMQRYAAAYGVNDNRWVFLRGPIAEVASLSEKGFMLAADNLPADHSSRFILVDYDRHIRGYYDPFSDSSLIELRTAIRRLSSK